MSLDSTLLIDADILCFQSCAAVEHEVIHEDDGTCILMSTLEDALSVFYDTLADLEEQVGFSGYNVFCFSDKTNFRKEVWAGYKAHRKDTRKPLAYKWLVDYVKEKYDTRTMDTLEADDVLGILATRDPNSVIWSPDKDLKQIPGKHLVDDEVVTITREEGDAFHMYQTLVGDTSDGYKGCPGIGPKKAEGITDWPTIVALFEKAGLNEREALIQARLARILRDSDYNDEQGVILWTPTKSST